MGREFDRVEDAFRFEKQVQGWSRAKRIALIEAAWTELPALASRPRTPDAAFGSRGLQAGPRPASPSPARCRG